LRTKPHILDVRLPPQEHRYQVLIGRDTLYQVGRETRRVLGSQPSRIVLISNQKIFGLYGDVVIRGLRSSKFTITHWLMGDGERFKSLPSLEKALQFLADAGLERGDAVVALGGGVVGDLAGFAAATYLRGIPLIQVPTTVIAQIDSAIGGKTGVNLRSGKNLVGAFHQPNAVVVDIETLKTLPARELVAGWCEAVKNGAVGGRDLFNSTVNFLKEFDSSTTATSVPALAGLIKSHCAFKAGVVKQDEREDPERTDARSRRILNFGHTVGHALEAATHYKHFRHGEAVGHGMLVAGEISKTLGLLRESELELLRGAVRLCGPLPSAAEVDPDEIIKLIVSDKKSVRGNVQWVLLEGIGRPRIVDGKQIPARLLRDALRKGLKPPDLG
jgi:3-dehydroquinate synthase